MDEPIVFVHMMLLQKDLNRFEHWGIYAARVLNASKMGSHILSPLITFDFQKAARVKSFDSRFES